MSPRAIAIEAADDLSASGETVLIGALSCWLGLIGWSSLSPGGAMPPAKADAAIVRVVTWNILCGSERGTPWNRHGWAVRKDALRSSLEAIKAGYPVRAGGPPRTGRGRRGHAAGTSPRRGRPR